MRVFPPSVIPDIFDRESQGIYILVVAIPRLGKNYKPWEEESQKKTSSRLFQLSLRLRRFMAVLYSRSRFKTSRYLHAIFLMRFCP